MENILKSRIPSSRVHIHFIFGNVLFNLNKIYNNNSIFSCASCASYAFRYLPTYQTFVGYTPFKMYCTYLLCEGISEFNPFTVSLTVQIFIFNQCWMPSWEIFNIVSKFLNIFRLMNIPVPERLRFGGNIYLCIINP